MQIQTFYPQNPLLAQHIAYYYFIYADTDAFTRKYYAFPNVHNGLTIYKSATFKVTPNCLTTHSDRGDNGLMLIQSRYQSPLKIHLNGPVDSVTIVFKPLGINHFINVAFAQITKQVSQEFTEWDNAACSNLTTTFFSSRNLSQRSEVLENFLLSQLQPFQDGNIMQKAIDLVADWDNNFSMGEIAIELGLSLRTLNRLFQKNLGLSPATYRKVLRFRESLKNKLINFEFKRLTDIGYESNFYDPSYFNKVYQQFTGSNPSNFFRHVSAESANAPLFQYFKE